MLVADPTAFAQLLDRTPLPDAPDLSRPPGSGGGARALVSADLPVHADAGTSLQWNGLVLAVVAVVVPESSLRRRERLGEVLRVSGQPIG